jgi:hypothetical protein
MFTAQSRQSTVAALVLAAAGLLVAAATGRAAAKPGFPAGTWIGKGVITAPTETVGGITTVTKGTLKFSLAVSKSGKVTGKGTWKLVQIGSGDLDSRIVGVAPVTFAGAPTNVAFAGTETLTTQFSVDGRVISGKTLSRQMKGRLVIKRAFGCKVVGGHVNGETTVTWTALRKGSKCV